MPSVKDHTRLDTPPPVKDRIPSWRPQNLQYPSNPRYPYDAQWEPPPPPQKKKTKPKTQNPVPQQPAVPPQSLHHPSASLLGGQAGLFCRSAGPNGARRTQHGTPTLSLGPYPTSAPSLGRGHVAAVQDWDRRQLEPLVWLEAQRCAHTDLRREEAAAWATLCGRAQELILRMIDLGPRPAPTSWWKIRD